MSSTQTSNSVLARRILEIKSQYMNVEYQKVDRQDKHPTRFYLVAKELLPQFVIPVDVFSKCMIIQDFYMVYKVAFFNLIKYFCECSW